MRIRAGLLCIIFSFISLSVGSALSESLTYDEVFYLEEGRRIWNMREFADPYNPPLAALLARTPAVLGFDSSIASRLVAVGLGGLLILAVYNVGGVAAAMLLAFEPTFLAHSHYVTGDIAVTLFVFLAAMVWMRFLKQPTGGNALLLGLAVGYALSSKMTSLVFLPIAFFAVWYPRYLKSLRRLWGSAIVALFIVWASYLFTWDVVIREREDPRRVSTRLVAYARERNMPAIEKAVTFFREQPLPLGTYIATVKNNALRIGKPAMILFNGGLYDRSRWDFMIANVLRKMPLPLLILVAIGAWRARRFAVIGAGFVGIASMIGMVPLVRYVLPAMPFLAIVAATGIRVLGGIRGIWGKKIISVLLFWYVVGTVVQYPHFISYANAFAGPRVRRFEVFADSNLDWGQALPDVMRYAKRESIGTMKLSYFGRMSEREWRFEEICALRTIVLDPTSNKQATVISISNWYYCGYYKEEAYQKQRLWHVVADSFLVF